MGFLFSRKYEAFDLSRPVVLNDGERCLLSDMYRGRLRFLGSVFLVLFLMGILYGQRIDRRSRHGAVRFDRKAGDYLVARPGMKLIGIIWLEIPILSCGLFIFLTRIHPLRKDLRDGNKYCIYHTVTMKQYFPHVRKYFISLDDPDYMHHEVDADLFQHINEGDRFPIYFARYSHYAFNRNGSYTVI